MTIKIDRSLCSRFRRRERFVVLDGEEVSLPVIVVYGRALLYLLNPESGFYDIGPISLEGFGEKEGGKISGLMVNSGQRGNFEGGLVYKAS